MDFPGHEDEDDLGTRRVASGKVPRGREKSALTGNPDDSGTKYFRDALRFTCQALEIRRDKFRSYLVRPWRRRVTDMDKPRHQACADFCDDECQSRVSGTICKDAIHDKSQAKSIARYMQQHRQHLYW